MAIPVYDQAESPPIDQEGNQERTDAAMEDAPADAQQ